MLPVDIGACVVKFSESRKPASTLVLSSLPENSADSVEVLVSLGLDFFPSGLKIIALMFWVLK